jgi:hypothetical protein
MQRAIARPQGETEVDPLYLIGNRSSELLSLRVGDVWQHGEVSTAWQSPANT